MNCKYTEVVKRSGDVVKFAKIKILNAVYSAWNDVSKCSRSKAKEVTEKIVERINNLTDATITVEKIQDMVEAQLMESAGHEVAKSYIIYRYEHNADRAHKNNIINPEKLVDSYLDQSDWRVKENANAGFSYASLINHVSGTVVASYTLNKIYPTDIKNAHINGYFHIHDLTAGIVGYCAGHSLPTLINDGFKGVHGRASAKPAKHFDTILGQMVNFLFTLQTEWAGAQAFNSVDTLLAPFVYVDKLSYKEVRQAVQVFLFQLNIAARLGQSAFTNLSFDWTVPDDLKDSPAIIGGEPTEYVYGDFQKEMDMINKAFIEVMTEGDGAGRLFSFPIPTYSLTKDFDWDSENANLLFAMTAKYGVPYFQNYIKSDLSPSDVRSMCPMTGDTDVIVASNGRGIRIAPISVVYHSYKTNNTEYVTLTPDGWRKAVPNRVSPTDIYRIKLSNGVEIKLGKNHLQPYLSDKGELTTLPACDLKEGMWLPFNKEGYDTDLGNSELGFAVGAFLGDGSKCENGIIYSLCAFDKDVETSERLVSFWSGLGFHTKVTFNDKNVRSLRIGGSSYSVISRFIIGTCALDKGLTDTVFKMSREFRLGLIEGLRKTDGSVHKKRIYTSSNQLRHDMQYLFSSIGRHCLINNIDTRDDRYSEKENYRVDFPERPNYGDLFKQDSSYNYYRIEKIEKEPNSEFLYCFEVDNESHTFYTASGLLTHNCRLSLNLKELRKKTGGVFGASDSTGSIGVVTLNLPLMAYEAKNEDDFFKSINKYMDLAKESLEIKRELVEQNYEAGLMPYTRIYLKNFNSHFQTIGLVGMNEACLNLIGKDITTDEGQEFAIKTLNYMKEITIKFQQETGHLFNLEATPAESTSFRLANISKTKHPDIICAGKNTSYFTNSSQLPVGYTENLFEALDKQETLQCTYNGGTVFHTFLGEAITPESCKKLVKSIAYNYAIPYFSITPTFSVCPEHGYISGEHRTCPHCK